MANAATNDADEELLGTCTRSGDSRDLPLIASNFRNTEDLSSYLKRHNIVAIADIDTRKLTRSPRERRTERLHYRGR
ncbi:carbamoyl-phosphate synthase domain-containing protein [Shigella flexneri]